MTSWRTASEETCMTSWAWAHEQESSVRQCTVLSESHDCELWIKWIVQSQHHWIIVEWLWCHNHITINCYCYQRACHISVNIYLLAMTVPSLCLKFKITHGNNIISLLRQKQNIGYVEHLGVLKLNMQAYLDKYTYLDIMIPPLC